MIDAANPPMPVMPGAPARQQANDGAERARPRRVQQDHVEDLSRRLLGMLRYGHHGFWKYMEQDTGYARIADIAAQLRREEGEIHHIAMESRSSRGPRYEAEERAGNLFIRATNKRNIRTRCKYVNQFHDPVNDAFQDSVNHDDLAGKDDVDLAREDDVGSDAGMHHRGDGTRKDFGPATCACCICFETMQSAHEYIDCLCGHLVCRTCLGSLARSFADKELTLREVYGGRLKCPGDGCTSSPYPQAELAIKLPEDVFELLLDARNEVHERQMRARLEPEMEEKVQRRVAETKLNAARRHITDEILTLKCPRCNQAYFDFDGCAALTCSGCGTGFCAWCGVDAGRDAHGHVACCPAKPTGADQFFGTELQIKAAQMCQKRRHLCDFMCTLPHEVQDKLREEMRDDFEGNGLYDVEDANVDEEEINRADRDEHWFDAPEWGMDDEEAEAFMHMQRNQDVIDAATPPRPAMPGAPARQQANDGAERKRPRHVQHDHVKDLSRMAGILRYGHRGFWRYMERDTGYARITDIAAQLRLEVGEIRHIAMESRNSRGLPRYEAEERAGVLFIRAIEKRAYEPCTITENYKCEFCDDSWKGWTCQYCLMHADDQTKDESDESDPWEGCDKAMVRPRRSRDKRQQQHWHEQEHLSFDKEDEFFF